MGLLNNIAGQVLGGIGEKNNMLNAVMGLLDNPQTGGLEGLVQKFTGKGLGDVVNSWVGTGQNLPISADQIKHGLGSDTINQLASKAGVSSDEIASKLSELLPTVVDKLTPNGTISQDDIMSKGIGLLKGFLN